MKLIGHLSRLRWANSLSRPLSRNLLQKLVADLSLDKDMLKSVISKNGHSSRV